MIFTMSLEDRLARAAENRRLYWSTPERRLKRINAYRAKVGNTLAADISDIGQQRQRDAKGRFAPVGR